MKFRKWIAILAAMVMLLLLSVPAVQAEGLGVVVRSAPLIRATTPRNGMVRVWLSSMGNVSTLNVTVTGNYSVNGNRNMSLADGESVEVHFDTATGQITMTMDGLTYAMGREMRLRRHQANGESAVSIAQARRPNNLFSGDLQLLSVQDGDQYRLYPIVHVYLEYYLYGVVPYEMSASFPLEALKAQAVAARTYTLRRMNSRSAYNYDLTDTSSDQVYYGYTGKTTNATLAVDATTGIIIMNDGILSGTYYTASNGGQTEAVKNAWGGSGYPYLGVKEDPFDALNTSSNRRRLTVYSDFDHANQNAALKLLLTEAIQAELGADAVIESIDSITPHTPKYAAPSRLYTKMDFGVTTLLGNAYADATLSFSIFDELEPKLGLNINTNSKNELWSAEKTDTGFRITVGRWGHGIGMSQRGAQQMAKMGYTYDQILGFYYEGCERVQYPFTHTILSAGSSSEVQSTVAPATITPAEQDQASLLLASAQDTAPLRYTASENGKTLTGVPNGAVVTVLARGDEWTLVCYGAINGYLPTASLKFNGTPPVTTTEKPTAINIWATVSGTDSLNFRTGPGYDYEVKTSLSEGEVLCILSTQESWVKVQWGREVGYVMVDYLTYHNAYPEKTEDHSSAMVSLQDAADSAPLLAIPSPTATVIMQIPHGTQVKVLSNDGTWCRVEVAGIIGYLLVSQLDFDAKGVDPTDIPGLTGMTAVVNSDASTLNLRKGPSTQDEIIAEIPKGTTLVVTTYGEEWCAVTWGNLSGYVMTQYLLFEDDKTPTPSSSATATPTPTPGGSTEQTAWVMGTVRYVNLRKTASTDGDIITTIPSGDELVSLQKLGTWTYVRFGNTKGYVLSRHLTYAKPLPAIGVVYVSTQEDPLTMRAEANLNGTVLTRIPRGEPVMLLKKLDGWYQVQYGEYVGYCSSQYLSRNKPSAEADVDETPIYDPTLSAVAGWSARVSTEDHGALSAYEWCSMQSPELIQVPDGSAVKLVQKGDIWCKITYEGETGYCLTQHLTLTAPE